MKMVWLAALMALMPAAAAAQVESNPNLGKAEGQCRPNEAGPAVIVTITGLKDRRAVTTQWFTVPGRPRPAAEWPGVAGEGFEVLTVSERMPARPPLTARAA